MRKARCFSGVFGERERGGVGGRVVVLVEWGAVMGSSVRTTVVELENVCLVVLMGAMCAW